VIQQIHLEHITRHENRLQAMQPKQEATPGMPGGPGGPPTGKPLTGFDPQELGSQMALDVPGENIQNLLNEPSRM
jgi:hypothetical protein